MSSEINKLKSTSKYPTSIIVRGVDPIGIELAESLIEQGGYVVMIDTYDDKSFDRLGSLVDKDLFTFLDFSALSHLEDDLRRLDYVFFLGHQGAEQESAISTQEFLELSNYLNAILDLSTKFEAKFLLTTSIKAHRRLVGQEDISSNFDPQNTKRHSVYSEVEVQRYAESLVMEYHEKVSLNVRILRIGEVVGEGIEFKENTPLGKLIFDAISGNNLEIYGDGLDEEYYVHYLDGVYGLLKAEFTPNTKGKIFSLANQEPVTTLSLAYKIQELEPNAGEIKFVEKKAPQGLKLYKPAENLSSIGWKPKVSFERALTQSIEQAYNHFKMKSTGAASAKEERSNGSLSNKLKNFFIVPDSNEVAAQEPYQTKEESYGALSRLIAERKSQDMNRNGSIVLASTKLRDKVKAQNQRPAAQRINSRMNKFYDKVKTDFGVLTKLTMSEFLLYASLLILLALVYFGFISPVLSLGKDIYFGYRNLQTSAQALSDNDIPAAQTSASAAAVNFQTAEDTFNNFEVAFDATAQEETFRSSITLLRGARTYSEGLSESYEALVPVFGYFQNFNDQIFYRPNDESLLLSEATTDYSNYFDNMESMEIAVDDGISKIISAKTLISNTNRDYLPQTLETEINNSMQNVEELQTKLQSLKGFLRYMPELFGSEGPKTYLILLQDNSRYNPSGGKLNSYALVTFDRGSLRSIEVADVADLSISFSKINQKTLDQVNLVSFQEVKAADLTINDFQLINDLDLFSSELLPFFETTLDENIDGMVFLNTDTLEKLIALYGGVEVEQIKFSGGNLLTNVDLILQDNNDESRREEIITQVFAQVLQKMFTSPDDNFLALSDLTSAQLESKDMILQFEGEDFQEQVEAKNWNGNFDNGSDFIKISAVSKPNEFSQTKSPSLNVDINDELTSGLSTIKKITIEPKSLEALDYVTLCLPAGATDLNFGGINPLLFNQNFNSENECTSIKFGQIDKATITYKTPSFESREGSSYNYKLNIQNTPGLNLIYDYELSFDSSLSPIEYDDNALLQNGKLIYAGTLQGDLILDLTFDK